MKNWTAQISDTTAAAVHDVLAGRDVDAFTDEALRREALRHEAGRQLAKMIDEAEASGEPISMTPAELGRRLREVHEKAIKHSAAR